MSKDDESQVQFVKHEAQCAGGESVIAFASHSDESSKRITFIDTRITLRGHGALTGDIYGGSSTLDDHGYTPNEFVATLISSGLLTSAEELDLIGCQIGLQKPGKLSYIQQVANLLYKHPEYQRIIIRGLLYNDIENKYEALLVLRPPKPYSKPTTAHLFTKSELSEYLNLTKSENIVRETIKDIMKLNMEISTLEQLIEQQRSQVNTLQVEISSLENESKNLLTTIRNLDSKINTKKLNNKNPDRKYRGQKAEEDRLAQLRNQLNNIPNITLFKKIKIHDINIALCEFNEKLKILNEKKADHPELSTQQSKLKDLIKQKLALCSTVRLLGPPEAKTAREQLQGIKEFEIRHKPTATEAKSPNQKRKRKGNETTAQPSPSSQQEQKRPNTRRYALESANQDRKNTQKTLTDNSEKRYTTRTRLTN